MKRKIVIVVGARPNFIKASPIIEEFKRYEKQINILFVHTGQHYDDEMSKLFFYDLGLTEPDIYLGVGSGTHAEQTANIMIKFEEICFQEKPDLVIVVGDVNSTVACALVASKLGIELAHVEAGLRSFDRTMPEEINRVLTDQISEYLFTTCEDANKNLKNEGIPKKKIFFVGNVMIDTLYNHLELTKNSIVLEKSGLRKNTDIKKYAIVTLHRPINVDHPITLKGILEALNELAKEIPVIFPAHPRTINQIKSSNLIDMINYKENIFSNVVNGKNQNALVIPPLGYIDFLCLMSNAAIVLTDSGGIQEETTVLGIPCLTLRNNTERPITEKVGTNIIVGNKPDRIISESKRILKGQSRMRYKIPKLWDGHTSKRIIRILNQKLI